MDDRNHQTGEAAFGDPSRPRTDAMAVASLVMGIAALLLVCTGVFAVSAGALGLIFGILCTRRRGPASQPAVIGIWLSALGMFLGTAALVYSVYTILTDPTILQQMDEVYRQLYGTDAGFDAYLQLMQDGASTL